jgi:nitrogen regulatory protein PII
MVRIEAIIRPGRLTNVRLALDDTGHYGISVAGIMGAGKQRGYTHHYRGSEYEVNLFPKVLVTLVAKETDWERIVDTIEKAAYTGEIGDGKIFVTPVTDAIRVRTGERDNAALS